MGETRNAHKSLAEKIKGIERLFLYLINQALLHEDVGAEI
jgi:hypothetical protein